MTRDTHDASDWDIATEAEFEAALRALLFAAVTAGLDPIGAWEYRNGDGKPDLEVLVSELAEGATVE